jgi:hypothetical protein
MAIKLQLEGWVEVPSSGWTISFQKAFKTKVNIEIDESDSAYFLEFLSNLQAKVRTYSAPAYELDNVTIALNNDGKVVFGAGAAETVTATFTAPTRALFGFANNTVVFSGLNGSVGELYPNACFSLPHRALSDTQFIERTKNTYRSDTNVHTQNFAERRSRQIDIRFGGWQRDSAANQMQGAEAFWRQIILQGQKFKYFPDRTISTTEYDPYSSDSFGWQIYRSLDAEFNPQSFGGSNYNWTIGLNAIEITE